MEQRKEASSGRRGQEKENSILLSMGYNPAEDGQWRRSDMLFGRGAALQYALRELHGRDKPQADEEA
jgi:hypothetical protein